LVDYPLLDVGTLPALHLQSLSGPISDSLLLWGFMEETELVAEQMPEFFDLLLTLNVP